MKTSRRFFTLVLALGLPACATLRNGLYLPSDPLSCEEHATLGTSYAQQGMTAEAEKQFRAGLRKRRDCTPAQVAMAANNLATVLLEQNKDLKEAEHLACGALKNAGALKPYVLDTLAGIEMKRGKMEEASQTLNQADTIAPIDNKALRNQLAESRKKLLELSGQSR